MQKKTPNILLIFTDMQRADTIHALGNETIKTPNLDRLVHEGTAFTSAYSPCPVCIPARWCMHYGQYTRKSKLYKNGIMPEDNGKSIPQLLSESGYKTKGIGKCHFTPEVSALRGFDSRLLQEEGSDPSKDNYMLWLKDKGLDFNEPHGTRSEMYYIPQVSIHSEENHPTTWIANKTIDFICENRNSDQPWFLFSSFIHPHPPFAPPKPWHKLYRVPEMEFPMVPEGSEGLYTWINLHQNRYKYRDRGIDGNLMRSIKAYYYATISFIDYQIGKIMETLEESGELDNTLILFASDHGEYLGDYNCFGKRSMHDASSRIPMITRLPGVIPEGKICNQPVSLIDVLPTCLQISDIDTANLDLDGISLVETATDKSDRKYVFSQYGKAENGIYMIVSEEWKYFYSAGDDREFLLDRINNPSETENRASDDSLKNIKEQLKQNMLEYLKNESADDAVERIDGRLDWKKYPKIDMSYLDNLEANLLKQDNDLEPFDVKGYV